MMNNLAIGKATHKDLQAIQWAREQGLTSVQTCVWTENRQAKGFGVHRGFRPMTEKLELHLDGEAAER